jgi:hypothetical protein
MKFISVPTALTLIALSAVPTSAQNLATAIQVNGPGKVTQSLSGPATDPNTVITYRAEPNPGAVFVRWFGLCNGSEPVCAKSLGSIPSGSILNAQFGWVVTVEVQGRGGRVIGTGIECPRTCSGAFSPQTLSLNAVSRPGLVFVAWGGDCATADKAPTCSLTISRNMSVTAAFQSASIRVLGREKE